MKEKDKDSFVNLENARYGDQLELMKKIREGGFCPFCPEHEAKAELGPLLKRGTYWTMRKNRWPYENTREHLLIIHNVHVEHLNDLTPEAWMELFKLVSWAEKEYRIEGGAIGMRFGDPTKNGATVDHIHAHVFAAEITDKNDPNYKPVRFRVG